MVANMATRPCLISVSRRLGDRQAVTRCHKKSKLSWSARRLATGHVFCIALCCIICLMSIQHPTRPLEDFDILVCRKTKGVPKAEGCLVTHKPFEALAAWCIAHSTYLLEAFVCIVLLQVCDTTLNRRRLNARSLWISSHFTPRMKKSKHCNSGCGRSLASPTLAKYCSQGSSHRCAEESPCSWPSHPRRIQSSHPGRTSLSPGHQQWTVIFGVEVDSCEEFRNLGKQLDRKE